MCEEWKYHVNCGKYKIRNEKWVDNENYKLKYCPYCGNKLDKLGCIDIDDWNDKLKEMLQPGNKVRISYGDNNPNNKLIHIRAIVDDNYIVYKEWGKNEQRWYYGTEHIFYYKLLLEKGHLE